MLAWLWKLRHLVQVDAFLLRFAAIVLVCPAYVVVIIKPEGRFVFWALLYLVAINRPAILILLVAMHLRGGF